MTDIEIAEWVKNTCLAFGSSVSTAYLVAGTYVGGLEAERRSAAKSQPEER